MKKILFAVLAAVLFISVALNASFALAQSEIFDKLAESVTAEIVNKSGNNVFNSAEDVSFDADTFSFNIHISYDAIKNGAIADGTTLEVELKPDPYSGMILNYPLAFASNTELVDKNTGNKLAKLDINTSVKVLLTFYEVSDSFEADINSSLTKNSVELNRIFKENPELKEVSQKYVLYINGKPQEKSVTFTFKKSDAGIIEVNFKKTNGTYKQAPDGKFGDGKILYNINISTKLNARNEFFIYDTPDVNLAFNEQTFKIYYALSDGSLTESLMYGGNNYIGEGDEETRIEIQLYDIYYLTAESASETMPRQAEYEDQTLKIDRDISKGKEGFDAMDSAAVPKNILVEKINGEPLNDSDKQKIDDAGGLNKTVGKGFKLHIKNFKQPEYDVGGNFKLIFNMDIVNPSPNLDAEMNPRYFNTASYYAQEIPTCDPEEDEYCIPIKSEKVKIEDIKSGKKTSKSVIKEGTIGAETDPYRLLEISKQDDNGQAVAGAVFTLYESSAKKEKIKVAQNKAGESLENLVSNAEGKLCFKDTEGALKPAAVQVERGYYLLEETYTPEDYDKLDEDILITVGFKNDPIIVINHSKQTETPETVTIRVTKKWDDSENEHGKRSKEVSVQLYAGNNKVEGKTLALSAENKWTGAFENLPKKASGKEIAYIIKETNTPDGYEAAISGSAENGFTITNKYMAVPTEEPTAPPTEEPTATPTVTPTAAPTAKPTAPPKPSYPMLSVPLNVKKTLNNAKLTDGQFAFELKDRNGKVIAEAKNKADGTVAFPDRTFSKEVSNWTYTINEVKGEDKNIVYDDTVYTVMVTTKAADGKLEAEISLKKDGVPYDGDIVFKNSAKTPQTGDSIYQTLGILISASVLLAAAAYVFNRKRAEQ